MFSNRGSSMGGQFPPATKNLIIINALVWVAMFVSGGFSDFAVRHLGLHLFSASDFNPAQLITYMFVHSPKNPIHILFNMFTLWMFGRFLEQVWGTRRFLLFYFICGIGAAIVQEVVWELTWHQELCDILAKANGMTREHMSEMLNAGIANHDADAIGAINLFKNQMITIGASGAIFGLLLGFAFVFPNLPLYIFFIPIPIKAKYMVIGYAVLEFFLGVSGSDSTIAHFTHLGGMIFGLIPLLVWKKNGTLRGRGFN